MSSTNKTTNYNLPIFVGSDVPSWLTDWNSAMQLLDTAIGNVLTVANKANADIQLTEAELEEVKKAVEKALPTIETATTDIAQLKVSLQGVNSTVESLGRDVEALENNLGKIYKGVLSAGETTLTLAVDELTNDSMIDVYTDVFGVAPTLIETDVTAKVIRLTFALQTDILNVKVKVGE